jgi:endonuclease/exonuclease/phosphatase family metal-dependent hydrolase
LTSILAGGAKKLRVASYNIHKCRGLDGRVHPKRIRDVLDELDADVVALQEVVGQREDNGTDHARHVAEGRGYHSVFGENRLHGGAAYGNLLLSRFPVLNSWNYNLTARGREARGVLRADVSLGNGQVLHLFNVHLGTAYRERCEQAKHLVSDRILCNAELSGARIVLGDFNEWFTGLASRLVSAHFEGSSHPVHARHYRTYPGILPFFRLDHIYFDHRLELERLRRHRSPKALVASDHLPIVADFDLETCRDLPYRMSHRRSYVPLESGPKHDTTFPSD